MRLLNQIVIRSDVANWLLPSPWPIGLSIGSAIMAVPVAAVTDRHDLGKLLLVPILVVVVWLGLLIARRLWCDQHPYLSQQWLEGARNVLGDVLINGALIRLRDATPRGQDRVLRRGEMIDAILAEREARADARKAASGVALSDAGKRRGGHPSTLPIA